MPIKIVIETGKQKVFASALDWPGWSRSAKTAEAAIEVLAHYAERYRPVAAWAELTVPASLRFDVVETLPGDGATDFGVPHAIARAERVDLTAARAARLAKLVQAAWAEFDEVVASAPKKLRKGPRGGGRDRDPMVEHVLDGEHSYARQLGLEKPLRPKSGDEEAIADARNAIVSAIKAARSGKPMKPKGWPVAYAARRIAWHTLDHAWEIQDKGD